MFGPPFGPVTVKGEVPRATSAKTIFAEKEASIRGVEYSTVLLNKLCSLTGDIVEFLIFP